MIMAKENKNKKIKSFIEDHKLSFPKDTSCQGTQRECTNLPFEIHNKKESVPCGAQTRTNIYADRKTPAGAPS